MEHLTLGWVLLLSTWIHASAASSKNIKEVAMDMAPNSFDDQYQGCTDLMEAELEELNCTEFNEVYAEGWRNATKKWQSQLHQVSSSPPSLTQDHAMALLAYTMPGELYRTFNSATLTAGRSRQHYLEYPFKVMHFLLSRALHIVRESQPQKCHHVYRGVKGIRFTAQQGKVVRFGQFTSSSFNETVAKGYGQDTFFSVVTYYGVPIKEFSADPGEDEVLIPPFEQFKVTGITYSEGRTFIQLRSWGKSSNYNCEFVKGRSSPMGPPHLWGLLLAAAALVAVGEP